MYCHYPWVAPPGYPLLHYEPRAPRAAPPPRRREKRRRQTSAVLPSPRSQSQAGSLLRITIAGAMQRATRCQALRNPCRGPYEELEGGHAPGVFHPDSRCTPAARALACPARIVKICWRPFSSGFPPSLASPLGPALGGGYVGRTSRWPAPDLGVIRREGCSLPEGLRARPMFPSHLGSDGAGFEKPGVGGEVPRASSAAPHGLLTRGLPPSAWAVNTRAIVKQSLTRAGAC